MIADPIARKITQVAEPLHLDSQARNNLMSCNHLTVCDRSSVVPVVHLVHIVTHRTGNPYRSS